jgi:hypothetical protein
MGFVYNIAVENDNSFVCNEIITHNCQCEQLLVFDEETQTGTEFNFEEGET